MSHPKAQIAIHPERIVAQFPWSSKRIGHEKAASRTLQKVKNIGVKTSIGIRAAITSTMDAATDILHMDFTWGPNRRYTAYMFAASARTSTMMFTVLQKYSKVSCTKAQSC
jgi:hypothetical protein